MIQKLIYTVIAVLLSSCAINPTSNDFEGKTVDDYDATSIPSGVLSKTQIERQWNSHKTSYQCLSSSGIRSSAINIPMLSDVTLENNKWQNIFIKTNNESSCNSSGVTNKLLPLVNLNPGSNYGDRLSSIDDANNWLHMQSSYVRYSGDINEKIRLKNTIIAWAKAKGLSSGIYEPGQDTQLDWQTTTLIVSLLTATGEIADDLTAEERLVIGKWLNPLMIKVGQQTFQYRSHNKEYLRAYTLLLWAIMVDDKKLIQKVINVYKNAIHEMRPDGSFPNDSQRGGMGLDYNSKSASSLVLIASLLKQKKDIDMFAYEVDGRSIHNAVEHVVLSIKEPFETNKKYAIRCPDAGDRWGSIEVPNIHHQRRIGGFLLVYASLFPEYDSSKFIELRYGGLRTSTFFSFGEIAGGAPTCQFKF